MDEKEEKMDKEIEEMIKKLDYITHITNYLIISSMVALIFIFLSSIFDQKTIDLMMYMELTSIGLFMSFVLLRSHKKDMHWILGLLSLILLNLVVFYQYQLSQSIDDLLLFLFGLLGLFWWLKMEKIKIGGKNGS